VRVMGRKLLREEYEYRDGTTSGRTLARSRAGCHVPLGYGPQSRKREKGGRLFCPHPPLRGTFDPEGP